MSKLPAITGRILIKALERAGFRVSRQKGSHVILKHDDGRVTVVPAHKGEDIGPGLLRKILADTDLSRDELIKLLD